MKFPDWLKCYGDTSYRGNCPSETVEQVTLVRRVRAAYPETAGAIIVHVRNEGKRTFGQAAMHKAEGMTKGASDILIPARIPLVLELKRRDHTKSKWQDGQTEYLEIAQNMGAFVCVALGADAGMMAIEEWMALNHATR